jgi:ribonuclease HII
LDVERALFERGFARVVGVDEVGRGAPAGPVSVGAVLVDVTVTQVPSKLRDSKLLRAATREALVPDIVQWARSSAVGHASAYEIDRFGLNGALQAAGHRAISQLIGGFDVILLDGSYDWLSLKDQGGLFEPPEGLCAAVSPVMTRVKADLTCASVAAASVLAKVARDAIMGELADQHPHYDWQHNKGYASPSHWEALRQFGASEHHRRSWAIPGIKSAALPQSQA